MVLEKEAKPATKSLMVHTFQNKREKDSSVLLTGRTTFFQVQNIKETANEDTQRER